MKSEGVKDVNSSVRALTAIIWSPTWMRPSWSTALSLVTLLTKMPEDSEDRRGGQRQGRPFWGFVPPHDNRHLNFYLPRIQRW